MEKNSQDNDLYDFAGQCFHREICGIPENTHNTLYFPWIFYSMHGNPLGHGAYDMTVLDDKVLEGRVTRDEIEKVVYEMNKSAYWIPAFPNDGRAGHGMIIMLVLLIWVSVMSLLGATHKVIGLDAILYVAGALLLGYIIGIGGYYWANNSIGDTYLHQREKAFIDIAEAFNKDVKDKSCKIEIGRYGAYITLRFSSPIKQLGALLMEYQRVYKNQKQKDQEKQAHGADTL